jgi:hypothetical protein
MYIYIYIYIYIYVYKLPGWSELEGLRSHMLHCIYVDALTHANIYICITSICLYVYVVYVYKHISMHNNSFPLTLTP